MGRGNPQRYAAKHDGAALVIGYAPSVHVDVEAARRLRPDAAMLGVKYACVLYQEIAHVWTQHLEQAPDIRAKAGRPVLIHGRSRQLQRRRLTWIPGRDSDLDYVWPDLGWLCAGSGFSAALWARYGMGFEEVIMCGIPMSDEGYAPAMAGVKRARGDGGRSFAEPSALARWRGEIAAMAAKGITAGITSLSGWTRDTLGAPC